MPTTLPSPIPPRRLTRWRIAIGLCTGAILVSMAGLPRKTYAFGELFAVRVLPARIVGAAMGWEPTQTERFRIYYADGFHLARRGVGFKCLPPVLGGPFQPAVAAWVAGFKAGRDSGGGYAPPPAFKQLID